MTVAWLRATRSFGGTPVVGWLLPKACFYQARIGFKNQTVVCSLVASVLLAAILHLPLPHLGWAMPRHDPLGFAVGLPFGFFFSVVLDVVGLPFGCLCPIPFVIAISPAGGG